MFVLVLDRAAAAERDGFRWRLLELDAIRAEGFRATQARAVGRLATRVAALDRIIDMLQASRHRTYALAGAGRGVESDA